ATHGRPTEENAHPHTCQEGKILVVHNGIFENYQELRAELTVQGLAPKSQTDTECFPLMMSLLMAHGLPFEEAFRAAIQRLEGKFAIACLHADEPGKLLVTRAGPTLAIGMGDGEYFVASDVAPLLPYTRDVVFLEDGDVAVITSAGLRMLDQQGRAVERAVSRIDLDANAAEANGHAHFMHKEIAEQPEALTRALDAYLPAGDLALNLPFDRSFWQRAERVLVLACGTSWHAGLVGKFLI